LNRRCVAVRAVGVLAPRRLVLGVVLAGMVVSGTTGCGRRQVELVPAAGVLTIGGRPQADLELQFMPDLDGGRQGPTSYGITGPDGRFELRTRDGRVGAVPGRHCVVVTDLDEERPAQGQPLTRPPRIDSRYSTIASGLTVEVGRGGDPLEVDIPSGRRSR